MTISPLQDWVNLLGITEIGGAWWMCQDLVGHESVWGEMVVYH